MLSVNEEDPFQNLDVETLISRAMGNNGCSADEYVNGDSIVSLCGLILMMKPEKNISWQVLLNLWSPMEI